MKGWRLCLDPQRSLYCVLIFYGKKICNIKSMHKEQEMGRRSVNNCKRLTYISTVICGTRKLKGK